MSTTRCSVNGGKAEPRFVQPHATQRWVALEERLVRSLMRINEGQRCVANAQAAAESETARFIYMSANIRCRRRVHEYTRRNARHGEAGGEPAAMYKRAAEVW
jgi:hypothetical protein